MEHEHHGSHALDQEDDVGEHVSHQMTETTARPAQGEGHGGHDDAHAGHSMGHMAPADHRAHGGHEGHGAHSADHTGHEIMFRNRFWVCLALSVPVLLYSPMLQEWFGFTVPVFPGSQWIAPLLATIVFFYGGLPFLRMAVPELRNRQPGMMTLISLAISVAFIYSLAALVIDPEGGFFWELVTLIVIMLLGHWLEMRSVRQASGALNELAKLMPDTAERLGPDGSVEKVPVTALRAGDLVLVRPGASVPADGEVVEGESDVNEAMLTGESQPVKKQPGDSAIAGAINGSGSDVAIESAGIILVKSNPLDVVKVFELSKSSYRKMKENLLWATGYNVVAIPLAAGVLYPSLGILLSPALGALFMSVSTIVVAINAQTLRRVKLGGAAA